MPQCEVTSNASYGDFNKTIIHPLIEDSTEINYCSNYPNGNRTYLNRNDNCPPESFDVFGTAIDCERGDYFLYGKFEYESTIVTDFGLVCDDQFKV